MTIEGSLRDIIREKEPGWKPIGHPDLHVTFTDKGEAIPVSEPEYNLIYWTDKDKNVRVSRT